MKYSSVLEAVYKEMASEFGLSDTITAEEVSAFGNSIGNWKAFPDTVKALQDLKHHYKLVILSNVDRESFSRTLNGPLAGISFDAVYVAEDIKTYKPDLRNFEYLVTRCEKELGVHRKKILHTAYALNHDLVPATTCGLATCWIKREPNSMGGELSRVQHQVDLTAQFPTLRDMADAVDGEFFDQDHKLET